MKPHKDQIIDKALTTLDHLNGSLFQVSGMADEGDFYKLLLITDRITAVLNYVTNSVNQDGSSKGESTEALASRPIGFCSEEPELEEE